MSRIGRGDIARRIARGDRCTDITIRCQHRTRHIDAPGLAVGIHRRLVGLGPHGNRHRITGFHVVINVTADGDGLAGLSSINHVIGRDVVDSNRRGWRNGIDTVSVSRIGRGDVARRIARGHRGTHITIGSQHRSRHVNAPGLAVHIHRSLVRLGTDGDRHRITRFHVVIDLTGDGNGLTRLAGVNHIIAGDIVDRD